MAYPQFKGWAVPSTQHLGRMIIACAAIALLWAPRAARADGSCAYNGNNYLNGSNAGQSGTQYHCIDGQWQTLGHRCALQSVVPQRACGYAGQSYASGTINCQEGSQARCDDGAWTALGLCVAADGAVALPSQARTCAYAGVSFQPQSTMCWDRAAFICQEGRWKALQIACE